MRRLLIVIVVLLFAIPLSAQEMKFAYVNSSEIMLIFDEVRDLERGLEQDLRNWQSELEEKSNEIDSLEFALDNQKLMLSDEEISSRKSEIEKKRSDLIKFVQDVWGKEGKAQSQNRQLFQPIYEKIMDAIRQVAQTEGYDYVFDVAESGIVHAPIEDDITPQVLNILSAQIETDMSPEAMEQERLERERREQEMREMEGDRSPPPLPPDDPNAPDPGANE